MDRMTLYSFLYYNFSMTADGKGLQQPAVI
jgi:hypothetical protein